MARNSRSKNDENEDASGDVDRYRKAAEDALQQLDWAIGYLHGIRKTEISRALARNRARIREDLMDRPKESMPAEQTSET
jgi:hypothetical protein